MAEGSRVEKYLLVVVTGVISLVVGVGSGRLLDFLRAQTPRLVYSISSAESFPGQQGTGIVLIRVRNGGAREAEDVLFRVSVPGAAIRDKRVTGVPNLEEMLKAAPDSLEVRLPFLNPREELSVHLLLELTAGNLMPIVDLRAKGVAGIQDDVAEGTRSQLSQLLSLGGGVLAALATSFAFAMQLRGRLGVSPGAKHGDDQRDVFAYVLDAHGLQAEAESVRSASRKLTYWAISDQLVARWLAAETQDGIKRGCEALQHVLRYADMASSSRDLIRVNLARLFAANGDEAAARATLAEVRHRDSGVIKIRLGDDSRLAKLLSGPTT